MQVTHCASLFKVKYSFLLYMYYYRVTLKSGHIGKIAYSIRLSAFNVNSHVCYQNTWKVNRRRWTVLHAALRREDQGGSKRTDQNLRTRGWIANCLCDIVCIHKKQQCVIVWLIGLSIELQKMLSSCHRVLRWNVTLHSDSQFNKIFLW